MNPEINLQYVHGESLGYGRLGVKLAEALDAQGVDVYDDLGEPPATILEPGRDVHAGRRHKITNTVCWVSTPTHARWWWQGQYTAMFTMWEATVIPEAFRESMHEFDQIIVPSLHNQELFSKYHSNVSYVPLGVDPAAWHYTPRQPVEQDFRFLIGGSGKRKGIDLAFRAFRTVFPEPDAFYPRPVLVMKNPKGENYYGPGVEMVTGKLSNQAERDVYASAHCYLQPSRGEGFGLQPLQAMAQGIPTILTDAHGHEAFARMGIPLDWSWSKADYFIYGDAGDWWEPDFDQLCEAMWDVYKRYDYHKEYAHISAEEIAIQWTWSETARKFALALGDQIAVPYHGDSTQYLPDIKRYPVRVRRPWRADIAGTVYPFEPGKEYWEPADVKRILFEASILDPACITDDDVGLTESQLSRVEHYRAENSYCPTCEQRYNSAPTKADDVYAEMRAAENSGAW